MAFNGVVGFVGEEIVRGWVYMPAQEKPLTVHLKIKGRIVASRPADIFRGDLDVPETIKHCGFQFAGFYDGKPGALKLADVKVLVDVDGAQEVIPVFPGATIQLAKAAESAAGAVDRRKAKKIGRKK